MTTVYQDSGYACTIYVSSQKPALSADRLQAFANFTQGGTIPFYVRWQYSAKYVIDGNSTPSNPSYIGWGPLDETVDKLMATPSLRLILNLAYFPTKWCSIDTSGKNVGYGNGSFPDGPAMATFATAVATRYNTGAYAGLIDSGKFILQIFNEEMDTGLAGGIGGTILAPVFNYAYPAIKAVAPNALIIAGAVRRVAPGGSHVLNWMTNFFTYVPKAGEPAQSLPYAMDFHYYRDGSSVVSSGNVAPDPTTTDNSQTPSSATTPNIAGEIAIIQGVLNQYSPGTQIWNLENGFGLPNNSTGNKNSSASELPSMQSRFTRDMAAQMHFALGDRGKYAFYTLHTGGNDPKSLCNTSISDYTTYIAANPQWTGTVPMAYLYQSVDALSFEGTTAAAPNDQYFSIMNPTGSNQSWSIASSQGWLVAKTLPVNGMKGTTGANLTTGSLAAGQCITLKCTADSTTNGLTTLTALTGTLTVTIGGNVSTITVSLFVTPTAAKPNITSASSTNNGGGSGPTFNMTVNASPPANQTITFKNQDAYATWWYAFGTGNWFTINTASGNLAANTTQNITISIASVASSLPPGTYNESLTISATPFPPTYTTDAQPTTTQFITINVQLVIAKSSSSAVQLSTSTFNFAAVASGALPASQTFYLLNCRNATNNWTVTKTQSWLTLSPASGSNLPANGSTVGTGTNIQHTDYAVVTASINSTALAAGTYTDTITVTLGSATATIAVSYVVSSTGTTMTIGASPTSLTLSQVQGGTAVSGTTTLTNSGNTTGTFHHTTTYTHGTGFITMTPGSGPLTGSGGTQVVTITCTPGSLAPDTYTGFVTFNLGSTSAVVNISFTVTSSASAAVLAVSPTTLLFNDVVGEALTLPQNVTLTNTGALSGTWASNITYVTGTNWIVLSPTPDTLAAGASEAVTITMNDISLAIGTYTATITFSAGSSVVTVAVTLIINAITTTSSAQMTQSDMAAQYAYMLSTVVGQQLSVLASVYYGGSTTNQVIYGELDALFPFETMSQLHVMKSTNDVTAFLNAYAYVAQVLSDSPIVYYRLGEASGIYAYDISGRNMTGTISTSSGAIVGVTQGQVGALTNSPDTAYLFDGTSGNITLPVGVNTANWSALTVECWIKLSNITFSQTAYIIANDDPSSTNLGFMVGVKKNAMVFQIGKGSTFSQINQAFTFAASTWYHLVGVFSGTQLLAYVNGLQVAAVTTSSPTWYNAAYLYKKQITIDQAKVSGGADLSNFPVLISLTDADLKTVSNGGKVQNASGFDIIFSDSTEMTKLDHEIEKYVAASGELEMWVRIPTLSHTADTTIYLYFGNSTISSSQENKTGVWDTNFKGIYHLSNGTTLSVADSTSNAANATNSGATATSGKIDGGAQIASDSSYISLPTAGLPTGANPFSVAFWVNSSEGSDGHALCTLGTNGSGTQVALYYTVSSGVLNLYTGSSHNSASSTLTNGSWYHLAITYDGTTLKLYVNGIVVVTVTITLNISYGIAYIGNDFFSEAVQGTYDEVKYSNSKRTGGWIGTEYNNQGSPSTFYSVGNTLDPFTRVTQTTNTVNIARKPGVTTNNFPGSLDEVSLYRAALSPARVLAHFNADAASGLSWLHVANGQIVNEAGTVVRLRGVNTTRFEFDNGSGAGMTQARVNAFVQQFPVNLWRLAVNVEWWNNNVAMPWTSLLYQAWIRQVIGWIKATGCYVEIDPTTVFDILPSSFPSQNAQDTPAKTQAQTIAVITSFYQSFLPGYVNDPAVLYNAINEPGLVPGNFTDPVAGNNAIIDVIQAIHPQALIFVYGVSTDLIAAGSIADYTQSNLVWDYHIYDDPTWSWRRKIHDWKVTWDYAQTHGRALSIGEWSSFDGGVTEPDDFAGAVANLVLTRGHATGYYAEGDLLDTSLAILSQGTTLDAAYLNIALSHYATTIYADTPILYYRMGDRLYSNDVYLDGFDSNTSANFSQTFNGTGAVGTWTWDTANSQITVTGGTEPVAVYSGTGSTMQDGFVEAQMNQAGNGGGLCARRTNASNAYTVYLHDSGDASPNTFALKKIVAGTYTTLASGSITFTRGTFHTIRLSVRGNVVTFYFDGLAVATVTDSSLTAAGSWGLIGGGGAGTTKFQFMTVATYGVMDLSTSSQNGNLVGGVTLSQAGALVNDTNGAILFDGISGAITAPLVTTAITNVSLECWVKLPSSSVSGGAIMVGSAANGYGIGFGNGTWDSTGTELIAIQEGVAWVPSPGATTISTAAYHHIVLTIDGTNHWTFYVDGISVGTVAVSASTITPTTAITIGAETPSQRRLNATIDEVAVYGYTLTAAQVAAHFRVGSTGV